MSCIISLPLQLFISIIRTYICKHTNIGFRWEYENIKQTLKLRYTNNITSIEDNGRYWSDEHNVFDETVADSETQQCNSLCDLCHCLASLFIPFGVPVAKDFKFIWLSYIWALRVLDECHSRRTKCNIYVFYCTCMD